MIPYDNADGVKVPAGYQGSCYRFAGRFGSLLVTLEAGRLVDMPKAMGINNDAYVTCCNTCVICCGYVLNVLLTQV